MIQTPEDRRPPLTPQLALRVAIVGSVALAMFAIIFFRLWFLQVLSGDQYLAQASVNRVRTLAVPRRAGPDPRPRRQHPRRLQAVDRGAALAARPAPQTGAKRRRMYAPPRQVLGIPTQRRSCTIIGGPHVVHARLAPIACAVAQQHALLPYANVTIKTDVSDARPRTTSPSARTSSPGVERRAGVAAALSAARPRRPAVRDRRSDHPGRAPRRLATAASTSSRSSASPASSGTTTATCAARTAPSACRSTPSAASRATCPSASRSPGTRSSCRSTSASRRPASRRSRRRSRTARRHRRARSSRSTRSTARCYAMGSSPTFDPNIFTKPLSEAAYQKLNNASSGYPAVQPGDPEFVPDRLDVQGHHGDRGAAERRLEPRLDLRRHRRLSERSRRHASQRRPRRLRRRSTSPRRSRSPRTTSSTTSGGCSTPTRPSTPRGVRCSSGRGVSASVARRGSTSAVRTPGSCPRRSGAPRATSSSSRASTPRARSRASPTTRAAGSPTGARGRSATTRTSRSARATSRPRRSSSRSPTRRSRTAAASCAPTSGSRSTRRTARCSSGSTRRRHATCRSPPPTSTRSGPACTPRRRSRAAPRRTCSPVGIRTTIPVFGKTGTAQHTGQADQSWYVCYVPDPVRPILVVVTVEQGGFGAQAAAPAARQILSQWFYGKRGQYVVGSSKTL